VVDPGSAIGAEAVRSSVDDGATLPADVVSETAVDVADAAGAFAKIPVRAARVAALQAIHRRMPEIRPGRLMPVEAVRARRCEDMALTR
jgi:hypothetical protein